jgi:CxxC motif-containing protein (DUF1111 family)
MLKRIVFGVIVVASAAVTGSLAVAGVQVANVPTVNDREVGGDAPAFEGMPQQPEYGDPLPGLTPEQLDLFQTGRDLFQINHDVGSGLGPIFNKESCSGCHNAGVPGNEQTGIGGAGDQLVTRFGRFIGKGEYDPMEDYGGSLLQDSGINAICMEEVPKEAEIVIFRVTTPMFGAGLLEAITDETILVGDDPFDDDGNGISGRAHHVFDPFTDEDRVGRFGWKAQVANLDTFTADASLNEMGITSTLFPEENDPNGIFPPTLAECDTVADPEDFPDLDGVSNFNRIAAFQRFLAPPPRQPLLSGEGFALFRQVGCADCHTPVMFTGDSEIAAIANRPAFLFSDLLLHDMGALGDEIVQGDAMGTEMRTPPLWGVVVRPLLLHDGRADSDEFGLRIRQAVEGFESPDPELGFLAGHAGEAAASRDAWNGLTEEQKDKIIEFLGSI